MTTTRRLRRPHRPLALAPAVALAGVAALLSVAGHGHAAALAGAALVVGAGLLLEVDLPWGGEVPLGHALLIAVAVLVAPAETVAVAVGAIAVVTPLRPRRRELSVVAGGAVAAAVASLAVRGVSSADVAGASDLLVLLDAAVVGGAFLAVDLGVGRRRLGRMAPLYVTLLCAAALLAVAFRQNPALSLVAGVPLLVTKYSFGRFTQARATYAQTTQALSLLPEVAGLTPLGHGERTAVYAAALADEMGFDVAAVERIATAARLHHIGHISLHEPEERVGPVDASELGRVSGDLLRETGFLTNIADLVERVQVGGGSVEGLDAAVIRVCSTLDDLAELDVDGPADPFAATLVRHPDGLERTAAIALLRLHDRRPSITDDARAASRILALVAAGAGHGEGRGHDDDDEPHDCR